VRPSLACGHRRAWVGTVLSLSLSAALGAQERPADFKTLYESADYDQALVLLAPLDTPDAHRYKALCLLALGRNQEAAAAVSALVTASPLFVATADDAPPRLVQLVDDTRKKMLPSIARRAFAEGREHFAAKRNEEAERQFSLVLSLAADPAFVNATDAQDLKTLAQGFIDLARASTAARAAQIPSKPVAPPPETVTEAVVAARQPKVVPAAPIRQRIPPIPAALLGRVGPVLSLVVEIDTEGKVASATVKQSAQPVYDQIVLGAVRDWQYTPASLNGQPIGSEHLVTIRITSP
jgi:TonB family protein